jgi:3-dehydroquinate synthetase
MLNFKWDTGSIQTAVRTCGFTGQSTWGSWLSGGWENPYLIIDSEVSRLWDSHMQPLIMSASGLYIMEAREVLKNTFTLSQMWDSMSAAGIRRDTPVIVVGGGMVCDIGAMAASTYLRGLRLMLVPTTLLCMVDACLGGKTGVNLQSAKNQLGSFYPAEEVLIFPEFLETLSNREFRSAIAEILKTAIIGDRSIMDLLNRMNINKPDNIIEIVMKCLEVKGKIVVEDLRENGSRMILNLGHTIGHALESASEFRLSHGESVGLGLIGEAAIAAGMGGNDNLVEEISDTLKRVGLPAKIGDTVSEEILFKLFDRDKKTRRNGRIWALPFDWCDCRLMNLSADQEESILPAVMDLLKA